MAYVKSVKGGIKCSEHLGSAIEYITKPSKAFKIEYLNCQKGSPYQVSEQFYLTQIINNKANGRIHAHHFEQSFSPDENITPELAFKIGKEFAKKVFPSYQVVMSTHIDKDHIHNHFVVNAINTVGNRYLDNISTLKILRNESDELCRKYNLNVINESDKKFKGIDQTTYQLGIRGKSWKINLTKDLNEALKVCKSKSEFIKFMESRDYIVKYQNVHITFQKIGEKKGIRTKKLAEEFGQKFSKENIDKVLGVSQSFNNDEISNKPKTKSKTSTYKYKNEYERLEEKFFERKPPMSFSVTEQWIYSSVQFKINPLLFTLKLLKYLFLKNKFKRHNKPKNNSVTYSKQPIRQAALSNKEIYACRGNISYKDLKSAPGRTASIKIYTWQLPKLLSQPFFILHT